MISILTSKESICEKVGLFALSREVYKDLGEPILFDEGDRFFTDEKNGIVTGFAAMSEKGFLKYFYILPEYRGNGVFSKIFSAVEEWAVSQGIKKIKAVSTIAGLEIYQKKGFVVTHSFTNYHKIEKQL